MIYRILSKKRLFIVSLIYLILGGICYLRILINNQDITFFESTMLTSIENNTIGGIYLMIIFPLMGTFLLSDIFLEDENLNLKYIWYTKCGLYKYHIKNIITIFITVFVITFLCWGFNILLCYISFKNINVSYLSVFSDYKLESYEKYITHFDLLLKSPIKFFILKNIYISLYGGLFAILSYLTSAFIKNKYILFIVPTIIYNLIGLIVSVLGKPGFSLYNLLYPDFSVLIRNPNLINIYVIVLLVINTILFSIFMKMEREYVN